MQTKPNVSLPEQDDIVVELTCRACNFEGTSSSDIKEHKSQHVSLTCLKCHFVAGRDDKLKQHILFKHVAPYDKNQHTELPSEQGNKYKCSKCDIL